MAIDWTRTATEVATDAYTRVSMLGANQSLSAYQFDVAKTHLNGMLKHLQTYGENQWRRTDQTVSMVQGQAAYVLNPRPDTIRNAFHVDANARELEMGRWNYDDYDRLPVKTQQGRPTVFTVDRQRTATNLVIWPTPDAANAALTLRVSYDRVMEDITSPTSIVDVPQEWLDTVIDELGQRCAATFRIENASVALVRQRAQAGMLDILGHDAEETILFTVGDQYAQG